MSLLLLISLLLLLSIFSILSIFLFDFLLLQNFLLLLLLLIFPLWTILYFADLSIELIQLFNPVNIFCFFFFLYFLCLDRLFAIMISLFFCLGYLLCSLLILLRYCTPAVSDFFIITAFNFYWFFPSIFQFNFFFKFVMLFLLRPIYP